VVYYCPKTSSFEANDNRILVTSPNAYDGLGVGTTKLYNKRVVYNHKKHGEFKLGGQTFNFQIKHHFPAKLSEELLVVDLVNNLNYLGEDKGKVLKNVMVKARWMDALKLKGH
jgi:hypothetical protein